MIGFVIQNHNTIQQVHTSLAWPDLFRAAAYRLEIISAALQGSGIVHVFKKIYNPPVVGECKLAHAIP